MNNNFVFFLILGAFFDKKYHFHQNDSDLHMECKLMILKIYLSICFYSMEHATTPVIM